MSDPSFKRTLLVSTIVHLGVVLVLILIPLFRRWLHPRKPPELITFIDLQAMPPAPPPVAPPTPVPPPVQPKAEEPKPAPVPEKPKTEPPKIKVSTNKIVRKVDAPPQPKAAPPRLTPEQLRKLLEANIKFSSAGSPSSSVDDLSLYYTAVRDIMYGAWNQPSTAARGLRAEVTIRVQRNGAISSRKLTRSSGSAMMDNSVMQAVNRVARLRSLPPTVPGDSLDITVEFVVGD